MKFLIAGAGAIGAYIGARMAKAGFDLLLDAGCAAQRTGRDLRKIVQNPIFHFSSHLPR